MSLTARFNSDFSPRKINDSVLLVSYDYQKYYYDFQARIMTTVLHYGSSGGVHTTPFSELDREALTDMRDKLIELKGSPPELPPLAPANPGAARKLNP